MRKSVMRKWAVVILSGIFMVTLAGCGTKTEATGQEVPESSSAVESEADGSVADESTGEEVIGDDANEPSDFAGAENESIVLYAEIAKYGEYEGQKDKTFESVNNILTAPEDVPVFNETDINPPAELGRLADASGDKQSTRIKPPLYNRCRSGKPHEIQRRYIHGQSKFIT